MIRTLLAAASVLALAACNAEPPKPVTYAVNPTTGEVTTRLGPPDGMADDIAFGPNGEMAWTGYLTGKVFIQDKGGQPKMISSGLPGSNSLAFTKEGRLYFTQ